MFKVNIPTFVKFLCLFTLPLLACGIFQRATPGPIATSRPIGTIRPTATRTAKISRIRTSTATITRTPISRTQAARRTAFALTKAAGSATATRTPAPPRQSATPSQTLTPTAEFPRTDDASIAAPALSNNILGESGPRNLLVYLPASYGQPEKRYPVVYYLLDFGLQAKDVIVPPENIQKDVTVGLAKELIVVIVSGRNSLGGSFYVNSPVSGNWDDFIAQDVVGYVDAHYRTIASASSRGISGYGVGGFGALSLAMHHPDTFGALYSISPTLFDTDGLAASPMFSVPHTIDAVLNLQVRELSLSTNDGISAMQHAGDAQYSVAYGTSFAPNLQLKPPYMDYPYYRQNGRILRDEAIWQRWQAGFGDLSNKVQQYKANLKKLNGITIACGKSVPYIWILQGCKSFSAQLTAANVTNQLFAFPGGIEPDLEQGIRAYALPFFAEKLVFEP